MVGDALEELELFTGDTDSEADAELNGVAVAADSNGVAPTGLADGPSAEPVPGTQALKVPAASIATATMPMPVRCSELRPLAACGDVWAKTS